MPSTDWRYGPTFCQTRAAAIAAVGGFDEIASRIARTAHDFTYTVCLGYEPDLLGCFRPEFTFRVEPILADAFFNGPSGYRAGYLASEGEGESRNRTVIAALEPRLIEVSQRLNAIRDLSAGDVRDSLRASWAKIWIDESAAQTSTPQDELGIELWLAARFMGAPKASMGLLAPRTDTLTVKGAFISEYGEPRVSASKLNRSFEIHTFGYS